MPIGKDYKENLDRIKKGPKAISVGKGGISYDSYQAFSHCYCQSTTCRTTKVSGFSFFHRKVVATAASEPNEFPLTLIKATVEDGGNA